MLSGNRVSIGLLLSIIYLAASLTARLLSLPNKLSSIQMSSVSICLKGLSSCKISSTKLIASVCIFCSVVASIMLSNSCFSSENSLFVACVSVSMFAASATCGSNKDVVFSYALNPYTNH